MPHLNPTFILVLKIHVCIMSSLSNLFCFEKSDSINRNLTSKAPQISFSVSQHVTPSSGHITERKLWINWWHSTEEHREWKRSHKIWKMYLVLFYLRKRRLRRVMATIFKQVTGECNITPVHCGHVTRKIQIRHKGILPIKVSKHWHCQVNAPVSVVFRDRCGMHCSEMT